MSCSDRLSDEVGRGARATLAVGSRALVVEDYDADADLLCRWLRSAGFDPVRVASLAAASVALADGTDFDLVLLDLGLPNGSGARAVRVIASQAPPGAMLIACSGAPEAWPDVAGGGVTVWNKRDRQALVGLLGACRELASALERAARWL